MQHPVSLLLAACACLLCAHGAAAAPLDQSGVEFARPGGKALLLDLHIPVGAGPFPAAILVHGGGFDEGHRDTNVRPLFSVLADAGFAWFSIDYRLAPAFRFPQAMADVNSAIVWVKANAGKYHIDSQRLALVGESAGGLLVNYAGTHETPDTQIAAVVDFYGPSDYAKLAETRRQHPERFDMKTINRHAVNGGGIHFFGVDALDESGLRKLRDLAPIAAVHRGMPPFLCIHGDADDQVSFDQSETFCAAVRQVSSKCDLIRIEGGRHGMSSWRAPGMEHWKAEMVAWLQSTLRAK